MVRSSAAVLSHATPTQSAYDKFALLDARVPVITGVIVAVWWPVSIYRVSVISLQIAFGWCMKARNSWR